MKQNIQLVQDAIQTAENFMKTFYQSHPLINQQRLEELLSYKSIDEDERRLKDLNDESIRLQGAVKQVEEQLTQHLAKQPQLTSEDTIDALNESLNSIDHLMQANNQEIGEKKTILQTDKMQAEKLTDKLSVRETLRADYLLWDRLRNDFGGSDGQEFRKIAQSYVLSHLLQKANFYLQQLTERYQLECQPGSLLILVRDNYQASLSGTSNLSCGASFLVSLSFAL